MIYSRDMLGYRRGGNNSTHRISTPHNIGRYLFVIDSGAQQLGQRLVRSIPKERHAFEGIFPMEQF